MKKITLIVTSLVFCIAAVFIFPAKQANANPLAVGGALYLGGAGIYVVGTLGVAAVAGLIELDSCPSCQEDLEQHASNVWSGATQTAKDGLQLMIDSSVGAWGVTSSALTATDSAFNTWMNSEIDTLFAGTYGVTQARHFDGIGVIEDYGTNLSLNSANSANKAFGLKVYINGVEKSDITLYKFSDALAVSYASAPVYIYKNTMSQQQWDNAVIAFDNADTIAEIVSMSALYFKTALAVGTTAHPFSLTEYNQGLSQTREAWQDMVDAGLVLPTDNARPMSGDMPLTYDPVTDSYSGIDGVNIPHEDVTGFEYQKPHWKTLEDLAMLGLSGLGAGLYIDGWVGSDSITSTYDPATDITTSVTSGTTTNVTTGETSVTSTTSTTTGDTTGNPTTGEPPPPTNGGSPLNPFKSKPMPIAALTGLFQLLAALIFYLVRLFTFIATLALIAPTPIDNPYFLWFTQATFYGIKPFPLVQNLALFFLGFSIYRSVRRVFG